MNTGCPICLETTHNLTLVCLNRHRICTKCIQAVNNSDYSLTNCPLCRQSLEFCILCNHYEHIVNLCTNNHFICFKCIITLGLENIHHCPACKSHLKSNIKKYSLSYLSLPFTIEQLYFFSTSQDCISCII